MNGISLAPQRVSPVSEVFSAPYVPFIATLCAENSPVGSRLFLWKTRLYPHIEE
jgi:hypothetical protein